MRRVILRALILVLLGVFSFCSIAYADKGVVVKEHDDKYCISADAETRFWVEEYMADEDEAWEFLYD